MIYLDNNSTTPLDPEVLEAMLPVMQKHHGNPSNKSHAMAWYSAELVQIAREQVASLINADPDEIIFTSGATESNNLAIKGILLKDPTLLTALTSEIEHSSVLNVFEYLHTLGLEVTYAKVSKQGVFNKDTIEKLETLNPNFISLMLANNEIGTIQDLSAIFAKAKAMKIATHSDATQAVGKIAVDVKNLKVDMLSFSAHKIYGPTGVGALYKNKDSEEIIPHMHGGGQEHGLRAGTLNVAGIVGFGKACEIAKNKILEDSKKINELSKKFLAELKNHFSTFQLNGSEDSRIPGNLNILLSGVDSAKLSAGLSTKIAFSTGSACQSDTAKPSHVLKALGLNSKDKRSSIRISLGRFNTEAEVIEAARIIGQYANKSEAKISKS